MSDANIQPYLDLLEKYNYRLVDGVLLTSKGTDAKIICKTIVDTEKALQSVKASNEEEARRDLLSVFDNLLKERSGL